MTADPPQRLAYVHSARVGAGGLGMCAATTLHDLAQEPFRIQAYGPGVERWPFPAGPPAVTWRTIHTPFESWAGRYTHRRWMAGRHLLLVNRAAAVAEAGADACFAFSGVALETLQWARREGLPAIVESATGHSRHFYDVSMREHARWIGGPYLDHPSLAMVEREEEEYRLAGAVRVSSNWSRASFIGQGIAADKIRVVPQIIDVQRFTPESAAPPRSGPLHLCYVGIVSLAKGFPYLLEALRALGPDRAELEIAGSTGTRSAHRLFRRLRAGLRVTMQPQDPVPVYRRAELLVFPSLHDGFGFAVAEAMACGLPVIVTSNTGASDWVTPECGWVVAPGDADGLAGAIAEAAARRSDLRDMGRHARSVVLRRIAERAVALPFFRSMTACQP